MKKIGIIILIGSISFITYWAITMSEFTKGVIEDIPKNNIENVNLEKHNFANYPSSESVKFSIETETKYQVGEPITIKMIWTNHSKNQELILIKDYWDHPMGVGISIKNEQRIELTEHSSKHFLSSELFVGDELKEFELSIKPNQSIEKEVDILEIPHFIDDELNRVKRLPKGEYEIRLSYYKQLSNKEKIQIE